MSVVKALDNKEKTFIEDYLNNLEAGIETGTQEEQLDFYRRQNEFLRKKLDFYAHLNSHQLRAPLVQIMGLIDMLQGSTITKREKLLFEYLQLAAGNMDEMIRCINRVLQVENDSFDSPD